MLCGSLRRWRMPRTAKSSRNPATRFSTNFRSSYSKASTRVQSAASLRNSARSPNKLPLPFRIDNQVEKLCGLRPSGNTPVVEIEQAQEKRQLPLPIQDLDLHEIRELPDECLHALIEAPTVVFDMRAQQRLHAVAGELRLQFSNRARGVPKQASERRAHSGFRPSAFEQNAIEDFHLIKTVALRLKELSPLL